MPIFSLYRKLIESIFYTQHLQLFSFCYFWNQLETYFCLTLQMDNVKVINSFHDDKPTDPFSAILIDLLTVFDTVVCTLFFDKLFFSTWTSHSLGFPPSWLTIPCMVFCWNFADSFLSSNKNESSWRMLGVSVDISQSYPNQVVRQLKHSSTNSHLPLAQDSFQWC